MGNRHRITDRNELLGQVGGIFSVNGMKAKLFSFGYHQALFSVLTDGKYRGGNHTIILGKENNNRTIYSHHKPKKNQGRAVTVIDFQDLSTNEVYKLIKMKRK